ncbi:hypothetical protein ACEWY4_018717 [Coilia grayii]|uniref:Sodium channel regulatory subunit beta-3 n=1 Tax=Coilia grayii TaxID=363190 RepID=A0ABD1JE04_9TELE
MLAAAFVFVFKALKWVYTELESTGLHVSLKKPWDLLWKHKAPESDKLKRKEQTITKILFGSYTILIERSPGGPTHAPLACTPSMRTLTRALVHTVSLLLLSVRVSQAVCVEGLSDTEAVLGHTMKLTCISCLKREDIRAVTRVTWYYEPRDDQSIPIYEYVDGPRELESWFKGRLQWEGSKDLQDLSLRITNITLNDSGVYVCEVFRQFEFDFFTPSIANRRVIQLEVKKEATRDVTALYSEVMMYVLLIFLTLWLLVEMAYCYRKISKADEQAQDAVYS